MRSSVSQATARYEQPTLEEISAEDILPMSLVRDHCRLDDLPGITVKMLELYRKSSFEAAEKYTMRKWFARERIEQAIESPKFRGLAQAAIARIDVNLDYIPIDGIVNIHGTGNQPTYWLDGMVLPFMRHQYFQTIKLQPGVSRFEMQNDIMFYSAGISPNCIENDRQFQQQGLKCVYVAGVRDINAIPAGVLLGCLKYIAWTIENPGDQFVPMVVRQVGVTTVSNDPAFSSGAIDEWRRHRRVVAR